MDEDRKTVLLKAAYEIFAKCAKGPFVKDALSMTVEYDDATCDGYCLMDDIANELGIDR